ncbi:catalase [Methanobrevibacter filiformis]|uniref:Catalase n=1 Tax=Methanobrevibacter filiformis TaxID=55758 RepID=A0A166C4E5_9EURY|nr:catalase [Methanobrevibacter filiformis]KZX11147.1 vegetative catalase [Methanobrevibacter filiformis]
MANKKLTTNKGIPVPNDQASITTGKGSSYTLIQDTHLMEKLAHFTRERTPERVVHAKGAGAHGYFEVTNDLSKYSRAKFLSEVGKKTDMFVRFSTVGGEKGSADAKRDPRGFALKFYTEEGNYDLVGNNIPIFFIRDAIKFPDFVHTQKRDPTTNLADTTMFWDFLSLTPESVHQATFLFTDRGTPLNYRHMDGFSSHTYMWYNEKNEYVWVKYHFKTVLGNATLTNDEAVKICGENPDHATEDLFIAIEEEDYPQWDVFVQIMTPEEALEYQFDPFDVTKVWYHGDYPLIPLGKMVLNRNPKNYFAEVEQAAFAPSNFVPGIGPSPDRLLQGRLFAYEDAQRHRLGANHHQIPINRPKNAKATNYQRDGPMNVSDNGGSTPNYYPNSFNGSEPDSTVTPPTIDVDAHINRHTREIEDVDFVQVGEFWRRVLSKTDKEHLVYNLKQHLGNAQERIQYRQTALFYKAEPEYGTAVANALGLNTEKVKELSSLTPEERANATKQ